MRKLLRMACSLLLFALFLPAASSASNAVLGEIHFEGKSSIERTSGVWIDGEYVGYLRELTGSKKVMLLPGKHTIVVRQDGYKEFRDEVTLQPGEKQVIPRCHGESDHSTASTGNVHCQNISQPFEGCGFRGRSFCRGMLVSSGVGVEPCSLRRGCIESG